MLYWKLFAVVETPYALRFDPSQILNRAATDPGELIQLLQQKSLGRVCKIRPHKSSQNAQVCCYYFYNMPGGFKKPKIWFFFDDWRILPDLEGSAAPCVATADPPGATQNSTDSSDMNISRSPRIVARKRMLKGLLLEARRKHAMRKRTRSSSSSSSGGSTAPGIATDGL